MMKLHAHIVEAKDLPPLPQPLHSNSNFCVYVKVKLGNCELRLRSLRWSLNLFWNEEIVFELNDDFIGDDEELKLEVVIYYVGVDQSGEEGILGYVNVPISTPPTWVSLHPHGGKILLTVSVDEISTSNFIINSPSRSVLSNSTTAGELEEESAASASYIIAGANCSPISNVEEETQSTERKIKKNEENLNRDSRNHALLELSDTVSTNESQSVQTNSKSSFEEAIRIMQSRDGTEMPEDLPGGILLDQSYEIEPKDMNIFLFKPNSQFRRTLTEQQGTQDYHEGPWTWDDTDMPCLRRTITYTKSATKLLKAVKATEEQTYLKADGKNFAILAHVNTPDVPNGNCFQVDLLYKIMPGPQLSSGEESSCVVISWNIDFRQSTVMKSVIEGSARQGLKESYEIFANLLAQYITPANSKELILDKNQLLAPLSAEHQSDWELTIEYLCNFTVISTFFMGVYVLIHIILSDPSPIQGLEFSGLDLPDTFGELIASGILVLQGERVFNMVSHFVKARLQRGSDHGIKAQGDGWLVTVALIEGSNLPVFASFGYSDPYVMLTCNGQTRTSSVQLQTRDPLWNEILEFDAMQEPPSVLDVEVFDFDGPFDQTVSLGHAEINFLKHNAAEFADMWVLLDGKMAQTSHSKLHLRIFVDNTKGSKAVIEYLTKMEKEVGKKLSPRSPHRNSTFQRHFSLPPEEFLIDDFSCYLKRRLPLQGRLYLSARIVGFHAKFFGHKTNFFFLWEDIEDIQVVSPSFSTVGSPALLIILRSGRGLDARHGAKSQDKEGRLRFQFQSFVSFNSASRTIMALWRSKSLNAEHCAKLEEDNYDQGGNSGRVEDDEHVLSSDGTRLSKALSTELSIPVKLLMEIFSGGKLEKKIMEKVGCLNYSVTKWEAAGHDRIYERCVCYEFNRHISIFGGEVTSTQYKTSTDHNGWIVSEVMTLHNVPFGDHFCVNSKYIMSETFNSEPIVARCDVFLGVKWMKNAKFKKRITKNIFDKLTHRSKEIFELAEKEVLRYAHS